MRTRSILWCQARVPIWERTQHTQSHGALWILLAKFSRVVASARWPGESFITWKWQIAVAVTRNQLRNVEAAMRDEHRIRFVASADQNNENILWI